MCLFKDAKTGQLTPPRGWDHSKNRRQRGYVPEENIVGKIVYVSR